MGGTKETSDLTRTNTTTGGTPGQEGLGGVLGGRETRSAQEFSVHTFYRPVSNTPPSLVVTGSPQEVVNHEN